MKDAVFSPALGSKPGTFVGRDDDMMKLINGLDAFPGTKERARLIIGQRGMGKTVLLHEIAEHARKHDYIVAGPTVTSNDMLDRILEKLETEGNQFLGQKRTKLPGGTAGFLGFSADFQTEHGYEPNRSFAYRLMEACDQAAEIGKGILILVDEIRGNSEELKTLMIAYQEMVGEGKNIAVVFAGLPAAVSKVLNQRSLTFFNRASKLILEPISIEEISVYYQSTFAALGLKIDIDWIDLAARETNGSPYLMQLIGHYITVSATEDGYLSEEQFKGALSLAQKEFIADICETTLSPLSDKDIEFLKAMAKDHDQSQMKDIAERMGVALQYAQKYKSRLSQAGIITQKRRGIVEFAVPYLKDYLSMEED